MRFARDILPLLIAGGGMAAVAKSGLLGGNNPLSEKELSANNQIWDRLGRGAQASPNAMGPDMPNAGNPLAGSAPIRHSQPAFANPDMAMVMPSNLAGGPMMAQMPMLMPTQQQPVATAGLLGAPDEKSQADFLKAQLYGVQQPAKPVSVAGGSATPQSNPFLYASLYNNNRQVQ